MRNQGTARHLNLRARPVGHGSAITGSVPVWTGSPDLFLPFCSRKRGTGKRKKQGGSGEAVKRYSSEKIRFSAVAKSPGRRLLTPPKKCFLKNLDIAEVLC